MVGPLLPASAVVSLSRIHVPGAREPDKASVRSSGDQVVISPGGRRLAALLEAVRSGGVDAETLGQARVGFLLRQVAQGTLGAGEGGSGRATAEQVKLFEKALEHFASPPAGGPAPSGLSGPPVGLLAVLQGGLVEDREDDSPPSGSGFQGWTLTHEAAHTSAATHRIGGEDLMGSRPAGFSAGAAQGRGGLVSVRNDPDRDRTPRWVLPDLPLPGVRIDILA